MIEKYKSGFVPPCDIPFEDLSSSSAGLTDNHSPTVNSRQSVRVDSIKGMMTTGMRAKRRTGIFGIFGSSKVGCKIAFKHTSIGLYTSFVLLLYFFCASVVLLLCFCCTAVVLMLCFCCTSFVLLLCFFRASFVLLLYFFCASVVLLLYCFCTSFVLLLYFFCTSVVLLLYFFCTSVVLFVLLLYFSNCTSLSLPWNPIIKEKTSVVLLLYFCCTSQIVLLYCYLGILESKKRQLFKRTVCDN